MGLEPIDSLYGNTVHNGPIEGACRVHDHRARVILVRVVGRLMADIVKTLLAQCVL